MMRFLFLLTVIMAFSCQQPPCGHDKSDFLEKMEDLADDVRDTDDLSKNDLDRLDKAVKKLVEECFEQYDDELTSDERRIFWKDVSKYYFRRHGLAAFNRLERDLDNLATDLTKNISEWMDGSMTEFDEWMKEFKSEDLEELKEELKDDLESWQEKLEEIIEEEWPSKSE